MYTHKNHIPTVGYQDPSVPFDLQVKLCKETSESSEHEQTVAQGVCVYACVCVYVCVTVYMYAYMYV